MSQDLAQRWTNLQQCILASLKRSGRSPEEVRLIGVSKKQPVALMKQAIDLGLRDLGENYLQEWQRKKSELSDKKSLIFWHFIGHLQSNKVKDVVGQMEYIHSVDSIPLAEKISKRAVELDQSQKVLVEIKLSDETQKTGFTAKTLIKNISHLSTLPNLQFEGLMCIPPPANQPEQNRHYFKKMKCLLDECNRSGVFNPSLKELSMGMSQDFEVAIEEGSTMIRVGEALFGPRK